MSTSSSTPADTAHRMPDTMTAVVGREYGSADVLQSAEIPTPPAPGKGKILEGGRVWRAFTKRGWIWQDIPTPDYQHFDTGYPSVAWYGG